MWECLPCHDSSKDSSERLNAATHSDHHLESLHVHARELISAIQILFEFLVSIYLKNIETSLPLC